jgi:TIR domain
LKIFISWSGAESERIANTLANWLPLMFQNVQPWISTQNLHAGVRWSFELTATLDDTHFGILCVTRDNMLAPWLLFEAGALSKSVEHGRVVPYLIGVPPSKLPGPLSQFQAVVADKQGTWRLVQAIESSQPANKRPDQVLNKLFEVFWPELETSLGSGVTPPVPTGHTQAEAPVSGAVTSNEPSREKTTEAAFLGACPEWARGFFKALLFEAGDRGLTVSWGTKGFSIRGSRATGEEVSVLYGYPPGSMEKTSPSLEIYLKYLTSAEEPEALRASLLGLGAFRSQGRYTIGLSLTPETLTRASAALPTVWGVYDRIRDSAVRGTPVS